MASAKLCYRCSNIKTVNSIKLQNFERSPIRSRYKNIEVSCNFFSFNLLLYRLLGNLFIFYHYLSPIFSLTLSLYLLIPPSHSLPSFSLCVYFSVVLQSTIIFRNLSYISWRLILIVNVVILSQLIPKLPSREIRDIPRQFVAAQWWYERDRKIERERER